MLKLVCFRLRIRQTTNARFTDRPTMEYEAAGEYLGCHLGLRLAKKQIDSFRDSAGIQTAIADLLENRKLAPHSGGMAVTGAQAANSLPAVQTKAELVHGAGGTHLARNKAIGAKCIQFLGGQFQPFQDR
jgi:hypothetical protein